MMIRRRSSVVRSGGVLGLLAVWALAGCNSTSDKDIEWMSPSEVRQLALETEKNPQRMLLVDSRAQQEFVAGHIPGAKNVPLMDIPIKSGRVAPYSDYDKIVVYGTNPDSKTARGVAKRFMANSYRDVFVLEGGLKEWTAQGGAIETGDK